MGIPVLDLELDVLVRDGVPVLRDLRWVVEPGEQWAVVGPNGSGKSSLAAVLAGYLWPSRGRLRVLGEELGATDVRELRRRIGIVTAALAGRQPPELPARTVVATGFAASLGLPWIPLTAAEHDAADEALAAIGAAAVGDRPHGALSEGERQRVAIARALVARPALLVLDEPCAGLDPVARERLLVDLEGLVRRPEAPTIVLVTHHLEELAGFMTHALALRDGRPVAQGRLGDVLTDDVLGEVFGVPCRVTRREGRWTLRPDVAALSAGGA